MQLISYANDGVDTICQTICLAEIETIEEGITPEVCFNNCKTIFNEKGVKELLQKEKPSFAVFSSPDSYNKELTYSHVLGNLFQFPHMFEGTAIETTIHSVKSVADKVIPGLILYSGAKLSVTYLIKATKEHFVKDVVKDIVVATIGIASMTYAINTSGSTAVLGAIGAAGIFSGARVLKNYLLKRKAVVSLQSKRFKRSSPTRIQKHDDCSSEQFGKTTQKTRTKKPLPTPLTPETPWTLAYASSPQLVEALQEHNLTANTVDDSLRKIKSCIFKNEKIQDPRSHYLQIAINLLKQRCHRCNIGNSFTEDSPFTHTLKLCNRCKIVSYCSSRCQQDDWGQHKIFCKRPVNVI